MDRGDCDLEQQCPSPGAKKITRPRGGTSYSVGLKEMGGRISDDDPKFGCFRVQNVDPIIKMDHWKTIPTCYACRSTSTHTHTKKKVGSFMALWERTGGDRLQRPTISHQHTITAYICTVHKLSLV